MNIEHITLIGDSCTTIGNAVEKFASTWWAKPRAIKRFKMTGPLSGVFSMVRGTRTYGIWFDDRARQFSIDIQG